MSFGISIMKNPAWEWTEDNPVDNWDESRGDHPLGFEFDGIDFDELHNFLDIKLLTTKRTDGESCVDYENRMKIEYSIIAREKGYEMLGRIWYWYENVSYFPSEINQLLEECLRFKENARNSAQLVASDKLITACNKALQISSGIFLASD